MDKQATRQSEHAHHVVAQSGDLYADSEITDSLFDSVCSKSMTPFLENLVYPSSRNQILLRQEKYIGGQRGQTRANLKGKWAELLSKIAKINATERLK